MIGRNSIVKIQKIFRTQCKKFSPEIPCRFRENVKIISSLMKSMTMFTPSKNPSNFVTAGQNPLTS